MGVETLKFVSLNVKGISNFHKRKTIYTWCRKKNADFFFLQETHSKKEVETQWKNEWGLRSLCHMEVQILAELLS